MHRLGLDPGERRIGVAISDELGLYAHPRPAIQVRNRAAAVAAVAALVREEEIDAVYVGLPLTLAGGVSEQTEEAHRFAADLRVALEVPVRMQDERLTTVEAARGRPRRTGRDGRLDSRAAAIMLQSVLDGAREP